MQYKRRDGIEHAELDQEVLLYDPANVKFCALNSTASFVWDCLASSRSFEALLGDITRVYAVGSDTVEHDLRSLLGELEAMSFVQRDDASGGVPVAVADPVRDGRAYLTPRLRPMDEVEVLSEFQVTSAGISWWAM